MDVPLEVQIGQMIMTGFRGTQVNAGDYILKAIQSQQVGAVWFCDFITPEGECVGNITSADQLASLIETLQQAADSPLLTAIDAEGGRVIRLKPDYGFPPTQSAEQLGQQDDLTVTAQAAGQIAGTLRELGITLNLAPVVDLNLAPDNPSLGAKQRCFANDTDTDTVIRHARAFIQQHHNAGRRCAIKHFPGQGSAHKDAHHDFTDITDTWSPAELIPFRELCHAGLVDAVLVGHVFHRQLDPDWPATLSKRIVTDLLRGELGYDGVVICDDLGMGAIQHHYDFAEAIALTVEAGVDIVLHANTGLYAPDMAQRVFTVLQQLVTSGRISPQRIATSYARIRRLLAGPANT